MRRTGAASIAVLVFSNANVADAAEEYPVGHASHCPLHGAGPCVWVTSIQVRFTTVEKVTTDHVSNGNTYIPSGRRFNGLMTATTMSCEGVSGPAGPWNVFTGGRIDPPGSTNIPRPSAGPPPVDNDTGIVAGSHNTGTQQTDGTCDGFGVNNANMPGRGGIEIHQGTNSTGCIVFPNAAQWDAFRALMSVVSPAGDNPVVRCKHHPNGLTVLTHVSYGSYNPTTGVWTPGNMTEAVPGSGVPVGPPQGNDPPAP
jgi:hypothetical protein